ncbi:LysM peptidoglycan-binding domain-containing protein [Ruminiclostridium cellulolyticum]|uniref:Protein serine/threonine phosphatase n=1 Tax=Ruminiclostridium cellulolyticum (strain ATCC 35319 / DSM 5812 / JCM 6584 / H10) TaxID=394503 RepID=B8I194_RUMCH|nr:LysM peptidoglycan-binding domain-containing protein [Ruminiclostridium cellulolyticum]ACL75692.1 protein serine/threonine phosphatase [Ruminiclostridium cellulolyticum H10]
MDGNIRLSATVISCMGSSSNKDDFYFNGSFANCHNTQSIQCSFEKSSSNFVFAVSDSLGIDDGETDSISAVREIKRYHENAKKQRFSLEGITEKIYEAVQLSSNLIYSKSVISSQNNPILTGFSSLIIENNRAVIMNLGNNGAFLFRHGLQQEIFPNGESRKNEKLKALGITPNTAELYSDTEKILKIAEQESKTKIKLSSSIIIEEGDIILLCSDGVLNNLSRSRIEAVIDSGLDPQKMASVLFQEASKNGTDQSVTLMVINVEEVRHISIPIQRRTEQFDLDEDEDEFLDEPKKGHNVVNYILGFICVLIISGVLFMGYLIVSNKGLFGSDSKQSDPTQATQTASDTTNVPTVSTDTQSTATDSDSQSVPSKSSDGKNSDTNVDDLDNENSSEPPSDNIKNTEPTKPSKPSGTQQETAEYTVHVVQQGETLSSISTKYYGTPSKYNEILKYNNMKNANSINIGDELKIPKTK